MSERSYPANELKDFPDFQLCVRCKTKRPLSRLVEVPLKRTPAEEVEAAQRAPVPKVWRCCDKDAKFCSDPKGEKRVPPELMGG